jgi:hypothetical protein
MAAYTITEDATTAAAKLKITNNSKNVACPNTSVVGGVHGLVVQVGKAWETCWADIEIYTEAERAAVMTGIKGACDSGDLVTLGAYGAWYITSCECTEAIFSGDISAIQVWKYHMTFVR